MLSTRAVGLGAVTRQAAFSLRAAPKQAVLRRFIQTESVSAAEATRILNKQRIVRPSSPHFTIYQPQLTWLGSIANRMTGVSLTVVLYGFSLAYLFVPSTFDSAHIVEVVQGLPEAVKYAGKTILALPFAFHSLNGLRHLSWDMGKFMTVKGCYSSGYAVLAATAVTTVALVLR